MTVPIRAWRRVVLAALVAVTAACLCAPMARAQSAPGEGPGGPILVVTNGSDPYGRYYAEILRAEGLNEFAVGGLADLNAQTLGGYQVVLLASTALSDAQASALSGWVQGGGNLIAMRPDARLAPLLGLGSVAGSLSNGYIAVATGSGPGAGITSATMQFHGTADRWSLAGAAPVAALYSNATTATSSPAVTLRNVGTAGGQAAAFTYDLARSVVWTRQGNPAWAGDERDSGVGGGQLIRADDLFFGAKPGDVQPDWVDLQRVAIPQADEQQRLLANLITQMSLDRAPLPRFWYFPRGERAVVVMTGDDHGQGGTPAQFDTFERESPAGCSVADWQCVRATSYMYPGTISNATAAGYQADGFEIALHLNTGCANFTPSSLANDWADQHASFTAAFPGIAPLRTNRTHCIAWSDWDSEPIVERTQGVRLDTNYYYWPPTWMLNFPGMFTGSGIPMRFADRNGALIDVYQAATQITDEWGAPGVIDEGVARHIDALLDRALGPEGYYGAFTANMHTDHDIHPGADAIVAAAQARGVPIISAAQLLDWLDGRNGSSFQGVSFSAGRLTFTVARAAGARGLEAMVPASAASGALLSLTRDGAAVSGTPRRVKGIDYVVFDAAPGSYVATYPGGSGSSGGTGGNGGSGGGTVSPIPAAPTSPPTGPSTGAGGGASGSPAVFRAKLMKHSARVSRGGIVRLQVRCPRSAGSCITDVRLRYRGRIVAKRTVTLQGGRVTKVKLRLTRRARVLLARAGSLRVKAVLRVMQGEGAPVISKTRVRLLAPGRR